MLTNQRLSKSEIENKFGLKITKVLSAEFFIAKILLTNGSYTKDSYYYNIIDKNVLKIVNTKKDHFKAWYYWLNKESNLDTKYLAMVERLRRLIND